MFESEAGDTKGPRPPFMSPRQPDGLMFFAPPPLSDTKEKGPRGTLLSRPNAMATVQMSEENTWGSIVSCAAARTETDHTLGTFFHFTPVTAAESEPEWNSFRLPETGRLVPTSGCCAIKGFKVENLLPQHADE